MKSTRFWVIQTALVVLGLSWWFLLSDWFSRQGSYRLSVLYGVIVVVASFFHVVAFQRFARMVRVIRDDEKLGYAEEGSTLFALNQRFRYATRVIESAWVLGLAIIGIISVHHPTLLANPNYTRFVITYFVGSVVLTGYLTYRDLHVLNMIRKIDEVNVDRARLTGKKKGSNA